MINRQHNKAGPLSTLPSQFSPQPFIFTTVSVMQMHRLAWLTAPSLVWSQKIGWNNTAGAACVPKSRGLFLLLFS